MNYLKKIVLALFFCLMTSGAYAGMVTTSQIENSAASPQITVTSDQRELVTRQLVQQGVDLSVAGQRVAQMTDLQVTELQGKMTDLPAGAGVSNTQLLLIIIIIILVF